MLDRLQYAPLAVLVRLVGVLPRSVARGFGILLGQADVLLYPPAAPRRASQS